MKGGKLIFLENKKHRTVEDTYLYLSISRSVNLSIYIWSWKKRTWAKILTFHLLSMWPWARGVVGAKSNNKGYCYAVWKLNEIRCNCLIWFFEGIMILRFSIDHRAQGRFRRPGFHLWMHHCEAVWHHLKILRVSFLPFFYLLVEV